jgi:hypothetical protein
MKEDDGEKKKKQSKTRWMVIVASLPSVGFMRLLGSIGNNGGVVVAAVMQVVVVRVGKERRTGN